MGKAAEPSTPGASPPNAGWAALRKNRAAYISFWLIVAAAIIAFAVPPLMPDVFKEPSDSTYLGPFDRSEGGLHLFGTDINGKDLFYRCLAGLRVSLVVGCAGALISLVIGSLYGMIAGLAGGRVDAVMMRAVDAIYSIPRLLFIMVFIAAFDPRIRGLLDAGRLKAAENGWEATQDWLDSLIPYSRMIILIASLGLVEWLTMARIVRGQVLVLREQGFVLAARAMGQSRLAIIRKHLLPNLSGIILTYLTLTIPTVILDESFLSFLGLGIDDPAASLGSLLKDGAQVINPIESKWWLLAFPAAIMSILLLSLNFLGDGLRDAFDPRSSKGR
ncbi:MAG: ABC transporter permease [Verrucomicrobiales bacterium]